GGASAKPVAGQMVAISVMDLPGADEAVGRIGLNEAERQYVAGYVGQYFGEPEGTNGPVYVGAVVFALFLLGCLIVKGPVKWALLAATLLSVFLALGRNMQWFTDLFIDYVPMYSRFRTVESILVVAEFTIPLLAILALQKLLTAPEAFRRYRTAIYVAFGAAAFFCVVGWLFPQLYGPAISEGDRQLSDMIGYQLRQGGYPADAVAMFSIDNPAVATVVENLRYGMVKADSLRSLIFIILAFGAVMLPLTGKARPWMGVALVGILVCADLYTVNKRYLSHDSFCSPELSAADPFPLSQNDRAILADTAMNFRVMDIPGFYQAAPSYHHKTIGGYHAAKLTRYQDLIDRHLANFTRGQATEADMRVLDMLNARYIITPDGQLAFNDRALGNAWFVDSIVYVGNADEEMDALSLIDTRRVAVADRKFEPVLGSGVALPAVAGDSTVTASPAFIRETTYAPDRLTYTYESEIPRVAVFSEVYFPWGWEAEIDGKPAEIGRVNYLLRAISLPAGAHSVEMRFRPSSVTATVAVARVAVVLVYLLCLAALACALLATRKKEPRTEA
ncbi:MAG: YfhO family protein, partial [Muribaculaceae bacterium]|nr:YfhO family protein [Muribaculaceae bacterium]